MRFSRILGRESEVAAVGGATRHEVRQVLLVKRANCLPLQLLLGHIVAVEVLPVAGENELIAAANESALIDGKVG